MNRKTQIVLMTLCMGLLLAWGGFGTARAADVYAQWDFNGNLLSTVPGGQAATVDASVASFKFVPATIGGQTVVVAEVTVSGDNQYVRLPFNFDPNWGQTDHLGQFTVISDIKMPNSGWGLLQPSVHTLTMAWTWDDYIDNSYGYMSGWVEGPNNVMNSGEWTRVVMTVDKTQPTGGIKYFFNGGLAGSCDDTNETNQSSLLPTTGSEIGTSSYAYYISGYQFNSVQFLPYTLSEAQVLALGSPTAAGIPPIGPAADMPPAIILGAPSVPSTVTGPVDFPVICMPGNPVGTMNLTPAKVSLLASEGSVTGTVEILNGASLNPTITVKDITGFGKLRIYVLAGSASNASGSAAGAGPSESVGVNPSLGPAPTVPSAGSKLWWDASNVNGADNAGIADGDLFTTWKDRSGNGNDGLARGTGAILRKAVSTLNGKDAAEFHSNRDQEAYNFTTPLTDIRTVFWVFRKGPYIDGDDWHYYWLGCRPDEWSYSHAWSGEGSTYRLFGGTFGPTGDEIMNGVSRILGEVVPDPNQPNTHPRDVDSILSLEASGNCVASFFCGHDRPGEGNASAWRGTLSELIIYNRVLTKQELNDTGRYLSVKYGLPAAFGYPQLPEVSLISPGGSLYVAPNATVELKAMATPGEGTTIAAVEFYVDWVLVDTVTTPNAAGEYISSWTAPGTVGSHEIFARAVDTRTPPLAAASAVRTITVAAPMFVKATGTGNGASWATAASLDTAFTVQGGAVIYMQGGTYNVTAALTPSSYQPSLTIYGGFAGTETAPEERAATGNETILDGVDYTHNIFICRVPLVLDRLTIKRGGAWICGNPMSGWWARGGGVCVSEPAVINNCKFTDNICHGEDEYSGGAGLYAEGNLTLTNCEFSDNTLAAQGNEQPDGSGDPIDRCQGRGIGVYLWGQSSAGPAIVTVKDCVFRNNTSETAVTGNDDRGEGGGMYIRDHDRATVEGCRFENNSVGGAGGALRIESMWNPIPITDCEFLDNTSRSNVGGSIYVGGGAALRVKRCVFNGNAALGGWGGGAIAHDVDVPATVDSSWFEDNQSAGMGGAICMYYGGLLVTNSVFVNNTSDGGGGAIETDGAPAWVFNNTFVGNQSTGGDFSCLYAGWGGGPGFYVVNNIFSTHAGQTVATQGDPEAMPVLNNLFFNSPFDSGNVAESGTVTGDPKFVSPTTDLHLQATSPAINRGLTGSFGGKDIPTMDSGGLLRFDGQPDLGAYELPAMGEIEITPDPLAFGVVIETESATRTLTLTNSAGNQTITITNVAAAGAGFAIHGFTPPLTILGGDSAEVEVVFTAPVVGYRTTHVGTVTVTSDATNSPTTGQLSAIGSASRFPGERPAVVVERAAGTPATTNVLPIEFNITFSEGVTGFELGDIDWSAGGVKAGNITGATLIPREPTGAQYTVRITEITIVSAGGTINPVVPASVALSIARNGNLESNTDAVVNYDKNVFGAGIATTASDITDEASVTYTVTFNGQVKAVDALALIESKLGLAGTSTGASIASVLETNASTAYTVEITTGGDGTLVLTLNDDDAIMDLADAPLNGAGSSVIYGPMIEVDKTAPTLVSIRRAFGAARGTNETTVIFEVTFSDIVTDVDADDFAIACSDATADIDTVAAVGNTALVVCNVKAAVGPYALSVKTAATMTNRVGLGYETATPDPNEDYFILTQAPLTSVGTWTLY